MTARRAAHWVCGNRPGTGAKKGKMRENTGAGAGSGARCVHDGEGDIVPDIFGPPRPLSSVQLRKKGKKGAHGSNPNPRTVKKLPLALAKELGKEKVKKQTYTEEDHTCTQLGEKVRLSSKAQNQPNFH